ncbi:MAG: succinylglutamate desuccinylase/aspartoacylase family protein [Trueperaceae bacterium]|nr:succinylglutamate desuccinylase/aspartoacylase family protein [Trueperaceae bacterium]MCC6309492.1 succinylglutamate desuccinylase/aspartoacylase family protein [Trueperaceae bacterium]MCO5174558.1 succinylglutamate desuccinylase/aspartoacylase family protein [Trueperaceae bacterium]MCW5818921.1 succinylglutamate desuccinylase/aspartoacylase family protein [Trueperaceae bacterium]
MDPFRLEDVSVAPGTTGMTNLHVGRLSSGHDLAIPVHVVHGSRPGKTLMVVAAIHGEEIYATKVIKELLAATDPKSLSGTLLLVPVGNPLSLEQETRNTPFDMLNMNRVFPGKKDGWISERLAAALADLVPRCTAVIHIDGGSVERLIHYIYIKESQDEWAKQTHELSRLFGLKVAYRGPFFEGSLTAYAAQLGVPCIVPEIGGSLLMQNGEYMQEALRGVRNIMVHYGMVAGEVVLPDSQVVMTKRTLIRIPTGGIFVPHVGLAELNVPLAKDTVLGTIFDPYTLEETGRILAPWDDAIIFQMRALMSAVQPGDYAYIIGDGQSAVPLRPLA